MCPAADWIRWPRRERKHQRAFVDGGVNGPSLRASANCRLQDEDASRRDLQPSRHSASFYFGFVADPLGRAPPHGSYFSFGSGIRSSAAL